MGVQVLDLLHAGLEGAIGACLFTDPEPVLVDPGPASTLEALEEAARATGVPLADVRHLCLTHVHLDHAGAAGHLARRYPDLVVHVHVDAAAHLVDPERLVASTRRTFGEAHDRLWGDVVPVPASRLRVWRPGERGPLDWLRALPTPGHIAHHLAYLDERTGTLAAGDALGIILHPDAPVHPPTPPPGVDLAAWADTLAEVARVGPEQAVVAHFGLHGRAVERALELSMALRRVGTRVAAALSAGTADDDALRYEGEVRDRLAPFLSRERADRYFDTFTAAMDYAGVRRYLERTPAWTSENETDERHA
jgi:glyoxylase-like metal-dependent hydrolase (beta-lactamase superfamily II)